MREWRELRPYFRALADVRRLRMVNEMARTPEVSVKELCLRLRASQPLVSWHLRVLVRCGLVTTRRQGRQVFCSLNRAAFAAYQARLIGLIGEGTREDDLDMHEETMRLITPPLGANT
jgi:DNA-binding transcriptional ArsR family regulator